MTLHPQIIEKEGKKEFVVLPYEEFLQMQQVLENLEDLKELRKAKEESKDQATTPLGQITEELDR